MTTSHSNKDIALEKANDEINRLSNQLLKSEEQRSNFLSNVLNEINNPITSILGLTKSIMHSAYDNPELVHKQANLTYQEVFDLDFKMRNIFAAAKIEAGSIQVRPVKVNIANMLENIVQDFQFKSKKKDLEMDLAIESDCRLFNTDSSLIYSIFVNLISNAIEYSNPRQAVRIELLISSSRFFFTIKDLGKGIHPNDQDIIFKRFKQLNEGSTKNHPGTGLGLSIVQEYIDSLNGTFTVKSQLNNGSTFIVDIPEFSLDEENTIDEEVLFSQEEIF